MRPITLALTLLVLATACENSSDPFLFGIVGTGGGAITPAQASGNWSLTLTHTTTLPCTTVSLADGTVLTAHLDVLTDGTLNGSTSSWQNPSTNVVFPLTGSVRLSDGFSDLIFSSGTGSGMELRGTMTTTGTFTGTLTDPAPGVSPMFSSNGCEYTTSGTKA